MANNMASNTRMHYIDALRGLAIILVVFGHIERFGFFDFQYTTIVGRFFAAIQIPLFFFISGFCAYKVNYLRFYSLIRGKFIQLVIPAFIVGSIYTYFYLNASYIDFISNAAKLGYWFPLSLFEMFVLYYCYEYIKQKFSNKHNDLLMLVTISLILYGLKLPFKTSHLLDTFGNYTSLHFTLGNFQFFVIGILARKYIYVIEQFIKSSTAKNVLMGIFFCCFLLLYGFNMDDSSIVSQMFNTILETMMAYPVIYILFVIFYKQYDDTRINRWLQFVGKRTMDIYLLHYFLLPSMPIIGEFLLAYNNVVIECLLGFFFAVIIVIICIIIGIFIRVSPIASKYILGTK